MEPHPPTPPPAKRNILKSLILPGIRNFVIGVIVLGLLLCLAAGTLRYWQGWVFAILFAGLASEQGIYLGIKDPELLQRRMQIAAAQESRGQKIFAVVALLGNACLMIISALAHRFGWAQVPIAVSIVLGDGLIVLSFILYYFVFEQNSYAATTIRTFEGQKVISTGLYGIVRHPKYVGDLLLIVGTPLALGSWWGLVFVVLMFPALAWRILDEERLLRRDLPGYAEYMRKVRYRLVPQLW